MAKDNVQGLDLQTFVDKLIEEKRFPEKLEKEVLDEIKKDLLVRAEERIDAVMISNLSEEQLDEFNKLIDKNVDPKEMQDFCSKSIPDLPQIIASELLVFRDTYLA